MISWRAGQEVEAVDDFDWQAHATPRPREFFAETGLGRGQLLLGDSDLPAAGRHKAVCPAHLILDQIDGPRPLAGGSVHVRPPPMLQGRIAYAHVLQGPNGPHVEVATARGLVARRGRQVAVAAEFTAAVAGRNSGQPGTPALSLPNGSR